MTLTSWAPKTTDFFLYIFFIQNFKPSSCQPASVIRPRVVKFSIPVETLMGLQTRTYIRVDAGRLNAKVGLCSNLTAS